MVGEVSGRSGGVVFEGGMDTTEIVDTTQQENSAGDGLLSTGQAMRTANTGVPDKRGRCH